MSIIMENTSTLLINSLISIKLINCVFTNDKVRTLHSAAYKDNRTRSMIVYQISSSCR